MAGEPALFRAAAAADVEEAPHRWYQDRRGGLGDEFLAAVAETLEAIQRQPAAAALEHRDVRRRLLNRFPYGLYYRLIDERIVVVACFHAKRHPRVWHGRR
jgi:toxin ParE1/3/4